MPKLSRNADDARSLVQFDQMKMSRRSFSRLLIAVPAWASVASSASARSIPMIETLSAVVAVLVPADVTPSAADLGVHHQLATLSNTVPNYARMLTEGSHWLEAVSLQKFGQQYGNLHTRSQSLLVKHAFDAPAQTLPSVFINRIRDDTMTFYYQNSAAWDGLGIDGPIQPEGYPDADKKPLR